MAVCIISNMYMPAIVSTLSSVSTRNGATAILNPCTLNAVSFFPTGKRLRSKNAVLSSSPNSRRANGPVVRAESIKEAAIEVQNTGKEVADQKLRTVERETDISPFAEEPTTEKLIQRAGEVCGFDTNKGDIAADVEAGSRTVKDKNPSTTHGGWEESGPTASISHELKSTEDNENAGRSPALEAATYVVEMAVGATQGLNLDRIAMERIRCRKLKSVEQMEPIRGRKKRWKGKRQ